MSNTTSVAQFEVPEDGNPGLPSRIAAGATLNTGQVAIGAAATLLKAANTNRYSITIANNDPSATVYIGKDNTVTTATGHALPAGRALTLNSSSAIYAIVAAGSVTLTYIEEAA